MTVDGDAVVVRTSVFVRVSVFVGPTMVTTFVSVLVTVSVCVSADPFGIAVTTSSTAVVIIDVIAMVEISDLFASDVGTGSKNDDISESGGKKSRLTAGFVIVFVG